MDPDSRFVPIRDAQGNVTGIMARDVAAYFASTAPDPSQRALNIMLARVTRVGVSEWAETDDHRLKPRILFETSDATSIAALRAALSIVEDPATFGHCMCIGGPLLGFYAGEECLATITLHHARSIRWESWKHDAVLRDGRRLVEWLAERGVMGPRQTIEEEERAAEERAEMALKEEEAILGWRQAMPECLAAYWDRMQCFEVDLAPLREALEAAHPDAETRALTLFAWLGAKVGPWRRYRHHLRIPELLLLEIPTERLIAVLLKHPLNSAHVEGALNYFAGDEFERRRPHDFELIPGELRAKLYQQGLASPDQDRIRRVQRTLS
jgi:hypothetical protein